MLPIVSHDSESGWKSGDSWTTSGGLPGTALARREQPAPPSIEGKTNRGTGVNFSRIPRSSSLRSTASSRGASRQAPVIGGLLSHSRAPIARHEEGRLPDQKEREETVQERFRLPSPLALTRSV